MPAFCSHYLFYEDMKSELEKIADFSLEDKALSIGTQGPDIFFFDKPLNLFKPKRKVGSALHRAKPEGIFNALCEYLENNNNPIAKSYAYGFILHYALDRNCHPYVYSKEREITSKKKIHHNSAHNIVEMSLDSFMLYEKLGLEDASTFDSSKTILTSEEIKNEIGNILSFVVNKTTDYTISREDVVEAIDGTVKYQNILRDESGHLREFCTVIETLLAPFIAFFKFSSMIRVKCWKNGIIYANMNKETWYSPYDEDTKRSESFIELFEYSKSDAIKLILGFEDLLNHKGNAKELTQNISFLTGRSIL